MTALLFSRNTKKEEPVKTKTAEVGESTEVTATQKSASSKDTTEATRQHLSNLYTARQNAGKPTTTQQANTNRTAEPAPSSIGGMGSSR